MGVRMDKIDRGLGRLDRCFGRIGKTCRWLNTTNDFKDAPDEVKDLRYEAAGELIEAIKHLQQAEMRMMLMGNWLGAHE